MNSAVSDRVSSDKRDARGPAGVVACGTNFTGQVRIVIHAVGAKPVASQLARRANDDVGRGWARNACTPVVDQLTVFLERTIAAAIVVRHVIDEVVANLTPASCGISAPHA